MEQRNILMSNTELAFDMGAGRTVSYRIESLIGKGSLCVLYSAWYRDNLGLQKHVKIKEYNPVGFHLTRNADLSFSVPESETEAFLYYRERVTESYRVSHRLFQSNHITNSISNAENIYAANNTIYIVYSYMDGVDLAHYQVTTLADVIRIVKSTAKTIYNIHQAGYLYLDIKPENILMIDGTTDLIQLFDFDSLIPLSELRQQRDLHVTYSKGFSPLEQRLGNLEEIGYHSDVYSIGALLYYLIFGTAPNASDCNRRAPYRFEQAKFDFFNVPDALQFAVSEFFRHTLQSYIRDRYPDMKPVITALEHMEHLTDPSRECMISRIPVYRPKLIGRAEEQNMVEAWLQSDEPVLFLCGMGGIGKTSLVISAVLHEKQKFDAVSYMRFHDSLSETIADDQNLCLRNMSRYDVETSEEYARRKLAHVERLCREDHILVILDDYYGEVTDELLRLFQIGWKIIVITREMITGQYHGISIGPIMSVEQQKQLFCHYLGRHTQNAAEDVMLTEMLEQIGGHTLSIELLAKQIRASHLSMAAAHSMLLSDGISGIGTEQVLFEKDGRASYEQIYHIISSLYHLNAVSELDRAVLKLLSVCSIRGIQRYVFEHLLNLKEGDVLNSLIRGGWVQEEQENISLHPLIREIVHGAEWDDFGEQTVRQVVQRLTGLLEQDTSDEYNIRRDEMTEWVRYALEMTDDSEIRMILEPSVFDNFRAVTCAALGRDEETRILNCVYEMNADHVHSKRVLMKLWDISVRMLCEAEAYTNALELLQKVKQYLKKEKADAYLWAFYYGNIKAEYLDSLLYSEEAGHDWDKILKKLLKANQKAIRLLETSDSQKALQLKCSFQADRANFLIRSGAETGKEIRRLLKDLRMELHRLPVTDPETEMSIHLAEMWYYTMYERQYQEAAYAWKKAQNIAVQTNYPDLERIDAIIVPGAEMEYRFGNRERSIQLLRDGITVCERYPDVIPYERKKRELNDHIQDVRE